MRISTAISSLVIALVLAPNASAQPAAPLAAWFDSDGYYNKPDVDITRATNDLSACRLEALRLKQVRNTHTQVGQAMSFNPDGSYNPVVSGAATGIASILFALQDARYNGGIERVEFRDCAQSLGYRRFILSENRRTELDATPDHGFAALVSASTPSEGRSANAEPRDNYFSAALVERPYQNATLTQAIAAPASATPSETQATAPKTITQLNRVEPGQIATPSDGMAIVVISARQKSSMGGQYMGTEFRFTRVTQDGQFLDLLQSRPSFEARAFHRNERRRDPSMDGDVVAPRYSTYVIPAGRYVLSDVGSVNTCLGTPTFEVASGDVAYLGDWVLQPVGIPIGSILNPIGNINTGMDNKIKSDLRAAIGDDLEAARAALQADDAAKARLARVGYQNGFRIPCSGQYIGRVANPEWSTFDSAQANNFEDAMTAHANAASGPAIPTTTAN